MKKSIQMSTTVQKALLNTVGTVIFFFLQMLTIIIVVRLSDFTTGGYYSIAMSFSNIFYFIALYGIRNFQIGDVENNFTSGQYLSSRIITMGASILLFSICIFILDYSRFLIYCCIAYMIFRMFCAFSDHIFAIFQRFERYDAIAVSQMAKGILSLAAFFFALFFGFNLIFAIVAMAAGYALVIFFYDLHVVRSYNNVWNIDITGSWTIIKKCSSIMLTTLITPYMTFIARDAVERVCGLTLLGYYSSISMALVVLTTLGSAIWVVLVPQISRLYIAGKVADIKTNLLKITIGLIFLGGGISFVSYLLKDPLLVFVFGDKILPYTNLLIPVIIVSILLTYATLLTTILIPMQKRSQVLYCNLSGAVVCTLVIYPLVKKYDLYGATAGLGFGILVQIVLLLIVFSYTIQKQNTNFRKSC